MSRDLIDRQTVVDALDHVISHGAKSNVGECHLLSAEGVKEYVLSLPSAQPDAPDTNVGGFISREALCKYALNQKDKCITPNDIMRFPSAQSEIIRCRYCKYWNEGNCNCPDIRVDCSDYYVGDIVTEEDFYCSYAKRRTDD